MVLRHANAAKPKSSQLPIIAINVLEMYVIIRPNQA
jgi:hypothetical protein